MPAHPVALALIAAAGVPVAAPSANRFGHTSPTRADHVAADLDGRIDVILDGGETAHGLESTVLEPREDGCVIYRPGVITAKQVRGVCVGPVEYYLTEDGVRRPEALPSPGVGMRHYAPRARMVLVAGSGPQQVEAFRQTVMEAVLAGERVGAMAPDGFETGLEGCGAQVFAWGRWSAPEELGQRLYAAMRELDALGVTVIVCPLPEDRGVGRAICDRLRKSARAE
jgi:L-threonylcarbamoyladenylate synthase